MYAIDEQAKLENEETDQYNDQVCLILALHRDGVAEGVGSFVACFGVFTGCQV